MTGSVISAGSGMPWLAAFIAMGAAFAAFIRAWSVLRKVELDAGGSMRGDLMGRIGTLEGRVAELERTLSIKDAQHSAEMAVMRHTLNNETASLEAFLLLARNNPDRLQDIVPQIMEMRERGKSNIAREKGAIAGAQISGATGPA